MSFASSSGVARLNDASSLFLIAVLALAPIPFGSNRPFFWAMWALILALATMVYAIALKRMRGELRLPFAAFRFEALVFVVVGLAILAQLAPIGGFVPLALDLPDGSRLPLASGTVSPGDTWFALLRWSTYGLLFFLAVQVSVQRQRSRFIGRALALIVALEAIYALMALSVFGDTILVFQKVAYNGVATGSFVNRNSLATFLGIGAVLSVSQFLRASSQTEVGRRERETQILFVLAFGLIVAALLATQSRMGLFATGLGVLTVILLQRRRSIVRTQSILPLLGLVAVIAGLAFLYGEGVLDRSITVERSADARGELYRQVVGMILDRPLLGYGAGGFRMAYPLFHDPAVNPAFTWEYTHSTYLALWSGLGVVAGSLPLLLVGAIVLAIIRKIVADRASGSETSAALGATVVVAVHSLVDFGLEIQAVAMLYTVVLASGAAKALYRRSAV